MSYSFTGDTMMSFSRFTSDTLLYTIHAAFGSLLASALFRLPNSTNGARAEISDFAKTFWPLPQGVDAGCRP